MSEKMNIWWDRLLQLIELLKPKFYNKLTWLIVVSGLGLMSKPLWLTIINIILSSSFELSITDGQDSAWGFTLVFLGLLYHLINTGLHEFVISKRQLLLSQKQEKHDLKIFHMLISIVDESYMDKLIAHIQTDDSIRWNDLEKLKTFVINSSESGNQFLSSELKQATTKLANDINQLLSLINEKFDEYPYGQGTTNFRMCLAPELNCDRAGQWEDRQKYDVLVDEMMLITETLNASYKNWRSAVKINLYI